MIGVIFYILLLLLALILVMLMRIRFDVSFSRKGADDYLRVSMTTLKGLVRYKAEVPIIDLDRFFIDPIIKMEADLESVVSHAIEDKGMLVEVPVTTIIRHLPGYIRQGLKRVNRYHDALKTFFKKIRCLDFHWKTEIGVGDPAYTGIISGLLWGVKGAVFSFFSSNIGSVVKPPQLSVRPCFEGLCLKQDFRCIFDVRLGHIMITGLKFVKLRFKRI